MFDGPKSDCAIEKRKKDENQLLVVNFIRKIHVPSVVVFLLCNFSFIRKSGEHSFSLNIESSSWLISATMGLLLSILFSYVGAVELMFIVRDIVHQVGLHHDQMKVNLLSSKSTSSSSSSSCSLHDLQENLRKSVKSAQERLCESDSVQMMADGIQYEQGYRIPNANEQDISKRWLEARASVTIEPAHNQAATNLRNDFVKATVVMTNDGQNNGFRWGDSLSNSIVSVETVEEKRSTDSQIDDDNTNRKNHLMDSNNERIDDNENGEMVPNIHFDEYSQDYSHAFDGMRKNQSKNDDSRRRKSYKVFTGGHSGDDILQRRRSEDIDGEANNPWGELKPESFHDHNLWKRERAMSIAENDEMMVFVDENSYQEIFEKESKPLNSFTAIENGNAIFNDNKTVRIVSSFFLSLFFIRHFQCVYSICRQCLIKNKLIMLCI